MLVIKSVKTPIRPACYIATCIKQCRKKCSYEVTLAAKNIGIQPKQYAKMLARDRSIFDLPVSYVKHTMETIQDVGFSLNDILSNPHMIHISPRNIRNDVMVLEELGFDRKQITPDVIINFKKYRLRTLSLLRSYQVIPRETNIVESVFKHLGLDTKNVSDISVDDNTTLREAYVKIFRYYMRITLNIPEETHLYGLRKWTSFRVIHQNMYICKMLFQFSDEMVIRNMVLLHADPKNTLLMIKSLTDLNIGKLISTYPQFVKAPIECIEKTHNCMKSFGVTNSMIEFCPSALTLEHEYVQNSLLEMLILPELKLFFKHPYSLKLLEARRKAKERLTIISKLRIKTFTLPVLYCSDATFVRFLINGTASNMSKQLAIYLSDQINKDVDVIIKQLKKHPFIQYASIMNAKQILDLLREMEISDEMIFASIQITLYTREKVSNTISSLYNYPEVRDCVSPNTGLIRIEFLLPLTLYFLERRNNFTGAGMWSEEETESLPSIIDKEEGDTAPIAVAC